MLWVEGAWDTTYKVLLDVLLVDWLADRLIPGWFYGGFERDIRVNMVVLQIRELTVWSGHLAL